MSKTLGGISGSHEPGLASRPGHAGFDPGRERDRIRAMSDVELAETAEKLRQRANLQSALSLADLGVARYEPPSDAVDRQLYRNLLASSRITALQRMIRAEQIARAESEQSTRSAGAANNRPASD